MSDAEVSVVVILFFVIIAVTLAFTVAGPLSGVYPHDEWPPSVKAAHSQRLVDEELSDPSDTVTP